MNYAVTLARLAALVPFLTALLLTAPVRAQDLGSYAAEVLRLVNEERGRAGLSPLSRAWELDAAAQEHSQSMADHGFFSHTGRDGSSPFDRMLREGYRFFAAGENIAYGYPTPQAVMNAWMNSPGHRANILQAAYTEIGIGVAVRNGGGPIYWTQDFGARSGAPTTPPPVTPPRAGDTLPRPLLTALSPASGRAGDTVTLTGSEFGTAGQVIFAPDTAALVLEWTTRRVVVAVPAGAVTGDVVLRTAAGTSQGLRFEVLPPTAPEDPHRPHIEAITPPEAAPLTLITILGRNFGWRRGPITVNGVPASGVISWLPNEIRLFLPMNVTSGPVVVTTEVGSSAGFPLTVKGWP